MTPTPTPSAVAAVAFTTDAFMECGWLICLADVDDDHIPAVAPPAVAGPALKPNERSCSEGLRADEEEGLATQSAKAPESEVGDRPAAKVPEMMNLNNLKRVICLLKKLVQMIEQRISKQAEDFKKAKKINIEEKKRVEDVELVRLMKENDDTNLEIS
ncbi:hypothetical protein Ccrd_013427 [Cynara cardunculus var. scolymus]|uniref:Uncharacterized protein n=1 Tax=Cynara cardunculus var. scolymus TaxID=59895 RepID=A0A118K4X8_CYNCS|nr:hypothetical protein Ccrd_013427 [Cynara cardunculus var. scolymus]